MQQVADVQRDKWPAGVQVKAVFGLAPVFNLTGGNHDPSTPSGHIAYAAAFFRRHLEGQRQYDPVLNGVRRLPNLPDVVQVKFAPPVTR